VEEGYTEELLLAEDREKQLRTRLAHCEQQIEHLEHQLRTNVAPDSSAERQQRDRALAELSEKEDRIHSLTAANERLQLVLDHSRKGVYLCLYCLSDYIIIQMPDSLTDWEEKLQQSEKRLAEERQRSEELIRRIKWQEERVTESANALAAAARLAEQMDAKQAQVTRLQEEGMHLNIILSY
jgi:Mg2+ and Co2+ transporter CorA